MVGAVPARISKGEGQTRQFRNKQFAGARKNPELRHAGSAHLSVGEGQIRGGTLTIPEGIWELSDGVENPEFSARGAVADRRKTGRHGPRRFFVVPLGARSKLLPRKVL